jgi:hypothetical protein
VNPLRKASKIEAKVMALNSTRLETVGPIQPVISEPHMSQDVSSDQDVVQLVTNFGKDGICGGENGFARRPSL